MKSRTAGTLRCSQMDVKPIRRLLIHGCPPTKRSEAALASAALASSRRRARQSRTTLVFDSGPRHGLGHHPDQTRLLDRLDAVAVGADLTRLTEELGNKGPRHHVHRVGGDHPAEAPEGFHAA